MFCTQCGTKNADGATFCANCGNPLLNVDGDSAAMDAPDSIASQPAPSAGTPAPVQDGAKPRSEQKTKQVTYITIAVLVIVVIVVGAIVWFNVDRTNRARQAYEGATASRQQEDEATASRQREEAAAAKQREEAAARQREEQAAAQARQNPASVNATDGPVTLKGKLVRQERTTDETGMGWASVDYILEFDSPVTITFRAPSGGTDTSSFDWIGVAAKELYIATDPDANSKLGQATVADVQPYVGQYVAVTGDIRSSGNAHTYGAAQFNTYSITPL